MADDLESLEQRLNAIAPPRETTATIIPFAKAAAEKTPRPPSWRFVPERDADNLITQIIATPIEDNNG